MNSRNLDLAAQFCELVNKPHLLDYLGLPEDASPDAAQKKLTARRKYMQGMQSNPKYKQEAMFLIKNFSSLTEVLKLPVEYMDDAKRRAESQHLPVLRMTIQGVLAGGTLNHDQEDFLRRNAVELGVSEKTFEALLDELCSASEVARANADVRVNERELQTLDFYAILGVPRHATRDEIYTRYRTRKDESQALTDPGQRESDRMRVEKAWKILGSEEDRRKYDLTWTRTGPPARNRQPLVQSTASTAPPIRNRIDDPPAADTSLRPASLELLSGRRQVVELTGTPVSVAVEVRNGGEKPLRGSVTSDKSWLKVLTPALDPTAKQQQIRLEIHPDSVAGNADAGQIRIVLENGQSASVVFEVQRTRSLIPLLAGAVGVLAVAAVSLLVYLLVFRDTTAVIEVDPWAEEILIDGTVLGSGNRLVLDNPPGTATVTVRHPNFKPWVKDVDLSAGQTVRAELELLGRMDFQPDASMKRAKLDQDVAGQTMATFRPRLDRCLKSGRIGNEDMKGVLKIHVGPKGVTTGYSLEGDGDRSTAVLECLRRQTAGPIFPALPVGDFATVLYEYVIIGP